MKIFCITFDFCIIGKYRIEERLLTFQLQANYTEFSDKLNFHGTEFKPLLIMESIFCACIAIALLVKDVAKTSSALGQHRGAIKKSKVMH